jgi:LPS-assembly lipoprotein
MSSPKRRLASIAVVAIALAGLGGCQIRPLYSTSAGEPGPQADLPAIEVQLPQGRAEQVFRNALLYEFRGGGSGAEEPRYKLQYRLGIREQAIVVERGTGTPNLYQLTGNVSFLLKDAATSESIFGASVTSVDSYARSSQSFSNIRARRDAENRLVTSLARLIQARLAAYFATH